MMKVSNVWLLERVDDFSQSLLHIFKNYPTVSDLENVENLGLNEDEKIELIRSSKVLVDVSVRGEEWIILYQDDIFTDNSK